MRLSYFHFLPLSDFQHLKNVNIKIDNIDCLPDFLCKMCCPVFLYSSFFSIIISPFWSPSRGSHSIGLCQNIILSIRPKMGTSVSSQATPIYSLFIFACKKPCGSQHFFNVKKRFNMMQPTTRSISNKYHCLSLLFFSADISLVNA